MLPKGITEVGCTVCTASYMLALNSTPINVDVVEGGDELTTAKSFDAKQSATA